jgi:hypothetical protein
MLYIQFLAQSSSLCQTQAGPPLAAVAVDTARQPHVFKSGYGEGRCHKYKSIDIEFPGDTFNI